MTAPPAHDVTALLNAWCEGDQSALEHLVPLVYAELHRVAHRQMRTERQRDDLQTTALIHEAYIRLIDAHHVRWQNRAHFFAVSARLMRQILVDVVRTRGAHKRGGDVQRLVDRCLEKQPENRLSSAYDLVLALGAASKEPGPARRFLWPAVALVVAAVAGGALYVQRRSPEPAEQVSRTAIATHARGTIAVLPLQNLSTDPAYAYFAGGLHDELLSPLSKVAALKVIFGTIAAECRAQILAQSGRADAALDEVERLLTGPSWLSVHTLRLDPRWDAIRSHPRFQALLRKYRS